MTKAQLIVALDFAEKAAALKLIDELDGVCDFFKIGMELGLRVDDEFIAGLVKRGKKIFLDYKYHDIGNTVEKAVKNAADLGVYMLTVHAEEQVLQAAVRGRDSTPPSNSPRKREEDTKISPPFTGGIKGGEDKIKIFGVTVLTSLGEDYAKQYGCSVEELVLCRAGYAAALGANGVISSPHEAAIIRTKFPTLEICTPGIRPAGADKGDQNRTATPLEAVAAGANYLVVGRPITQAKNPRQVAEEVIKSLHV